MWSKELSYNKIAPLTWQSQTGYNYAVMETVRTELKMEFPNTKIIIRDLKREQQGFFTATQMTVEIRFYDETDEAQFIFSRHVE